MTPFDGHLPRGTLQRKNRLQMEEESVPSLFPEFGDGELAGRSQDLMLPEPYFFPSIEHLVERQCCGLLSRWWSSFERRPGHVAWWVDLGS